MKVVLVLLILLLTFTSAAKGSPLLISVLKDGIGVRPAGMGGAFTALVNDAAAIFYNPAGLGFERNQYLNGDLDLKKARTNLSDYRLAEVINFGVGNWRQESLAGEKVEVSSFSYGRLGENGVAWGFTYKRVNLSSASEEGWSVDGGILYPLSPQMRAGLSVMDAFSEKLDVQPSIRTGIIYLMGERTVLSADLELRDLKRAEGMTIYMHYGAETPVTDGLVLRAGWEKDLFSAGVTAELPFGTIDYAVSARADTQGGAVHRVGWRIGN